MARDIEIVCQYYICEGQCSKGREGTFRKACQHCSLYTHLKGGKPARVDNRRRKFEKYSKHERNDY